MAIFPAYSPRLTVALDTGLPSQNAWFFHGLQEGGRPGYESRLTAGSIAVSTPQPEALTDLIFLPIQSIASLGHHQMGQLHTK